MADGPEPEELLESRHWQPTRRVWLGGIVAAVAVGVGGFALTNGGADTAPQAARTSAAPTSSPVATASTVPRTVCLDVGDSALNCGVSAALPPATVQAGRTVLPGASVVSASTVTGRDGRVYSRRVLLRSGDGSTVQLLISPELGQRDRVDIDGAGEGQAVSVGTDVGRRHVQVVVRVQPGRSVPTITALQRLARDPRLLSVR